jgi:hypothetical protein
MPQLSVVQWITTALAVIGGVAVILRALVQAGLPLQSEVKVIDFVLKLLNGIAMNPSAARARKLPPKKNPVVGTELKGKLVPVLLVGLALQLTACAWFKANGASAAVDCATTEIADGIVAKINGGSTNAANWQEQLGGYLASEVDCVLRKWLASQTGFAERSPEATRRANFWLATHPQPK